MRKRARRRSTSSRCVLAASETAMALGALARSASQAAPARILVALPSLRAPQLRAPRAPLTACHPQPLSACARQGLRGARGARGALHQRQPLWGSSSLSRPPHERYTKRRGGLLRAFAHHRRRRRRYSPPRSSPPPTWHLSAFARHAVVMESRRRSRLAAAAKTLAWAERLAQASSVPCDPTRGRPALQDRRRSGSHSPRSPAVQRERAEDQELRQP